jgi:hypothetical protein
MNDDIAPIGRWDQIRRRAHQAAEAAVMRAEAARRRRNKAERRVRALKDEQAHSGQWTTSAAERADAAAEAVATAQAHAVEALDRSAEAHAASARAHERAAETAGNTHAAAARWHRNAAAEAREAAERDRHDADERRWRL